LPGQTLPSWGLLIGGLAPQRLLASLRAGDPAVIARVMDDAVVLDLRTIEPVDDEALAAAVRTAIAVTAESARA
jgi:L-seryl-tRNA(Ser) seleniumtransferase